MPLRELLYLELWSKQTSRRLLRIVGITVIAMFALGTALATVERFWITPSEKISLRAALKAVDDLGLAGPNDGDYRRRKEEAKAAVAKAEEGGWTLRDKSLAMLVDLHLWNVEHGHELPEVEAALHRYHQVHPEPTVSRMDFAAERRQTDEFDALLVKQLHQALD